MKCEFCGRKATRVTMMYSWKKKGQELKPYREEPVCEKHYLEFQHGICTIKCPSCNKETLVTANFYYDNKPIYCSHCTMLLADK